MKTRTYPTFSNGRAPGYSLLELLVSLGVLALITAVSVPLFGPVIDSYRVKSAAHEITDVLKRTRQQAIVEQAESAFFLDTDDFLYRAPGAELRLDIPPETAISIITATSETVNESGGSIRFFHDGSATGGSILLAHRDRQYRIAIDWLTGHVELE